MAGEGTGKESGTVQGTPPAEGAGGQGQSGGGGGSPDKSGAAGGAGGAGEGKEFDRSKLHPSLRGMSPEEMTDLFETMATSLRTVQARGAGGGVDTSGVPEHARRPEPPKPPPAPTKEEYQAMLDPHSDKFDPEAAFRAFAERNYGHMFGEVNVRSIKGMFGQFREQLPDFKDYEAEIVQSLTNSGKPATALTEQDVLNTYFGVKGMKMTVKERQEAAKKTASTLPPSPATDTKKEPELTDIEVEVANKMFRRIPKQEDRVKEYKKFLGFDEGGVTMKVPIGGGKSE